MSFRKPVYLDYNATTPVDPRVLEKMLPWFSENFGNAASSTHPYGWAADTIVKTSRTKIANFIGAEAKELTFTSGSTEALNLGIKGVAELYQRKGKHIISVATEHKAVLDPCNYLATKGFEITVLGVDEKGHLNLDELKAALKEETVLVCVMLANNETGLIHPLKEISDLAHSVGGLMMTDATQGIGKIPVDVNALGIDILAMSAHKFYGPKGVGAIYLRKRNPRAVVAPLFHGGGHEYGVRSGTLNVPGIVGMCEAIEVLKTDMDSDNERLSALRDRLEKGLLEIGGVHVNGDPENRLPNVSNLSFEGVDGQKLVNKMKGVAVSHGSACTSAKMEPSHVLAAMGLKEELAYASVRFSLGRMTTKEELDFAIGHVKEAVEQLRG